MSPDDRSSFVPRCGIDPLISPSLVAAVARATMTTDDDCILILVDHDLIGHLIIVVDDDIAPYLDVIAHADTGISRVIVAQRREMPSTPIDVDRLRRVARAVNIAVVDVVAFDDTCAWSLVDPDQESAVDRRTLAESRRPDSRNRPSNSRLETSTAPDSTARDRHSSGRS